MMIPTWFSIVALPIIAAFIGWLTNFLAVKMLFYPRRPIPLLGFSLQGVFPKRQAALASKIGKLVSTELFSTDDIVEKLKQGAHSREMFSFISPRVEQLITVELPRQLPMVGMFLNPETVDKLKKTIMKLLAPLIDGVIDRLQTNLEDELDVQRMVEKKVTSFSSEKLEELLTAVMKKEFRFIELIGGVLGFVIGCVQVALVHFTQGW